MERGVKDVSDVPLTTWAGALMLQEYGVIGFVSDARRKYSTFVNGFVSATTWAKDPKPKPPKFDDMHPLEGLFERKGDSPEKVAWKARRRREEGDRPNKS